jgi:hypothetical protein
MLLFNFPGLDALVNVGSCAGDGGGAHRARGRARRRRVPGGAAGELRGLAGFTEQVGPRACASHPPRWRSAPIERVRRSRSGRLLRQPVLRPGRRRGARGAGPRSARRRRRARRPAGPR